MNNSINRIWFGAVGISAALSLLCGCQWMGQSISKMSEWKMPQPPKLFAKKDNSPPPPPSRHFNDDSQRIASPAEQLTGTNGREPIQKPSETDRPTEMLAGRGRPTSKPNEGDGDTPQAPFKFPEAERSFTQPGVATFSPDQPAMPRAPYEAPRSTVSQNPPTSSASFQPGEFGGSFQPNLSQVSIAQSTSENSFGGGSLNSRFGSAPSGTAADSQQGGGQSSSGFTGSPNPAGASIPSFAVVPSGGVGNDAYAAPPANSGSLMPRIGSDQSLGSTALSPHAASSFGQTGSNEISPPVREYRQTPHASFSEAPRSANATEPPAPSAYANFGGFSSSLTVPESAATYQPVSHVAEIPEELRPKGNAYAPGSLSRLNSTAAPNSMWR
ncbi:MAG TPA: hypothetical protein PKD54_08615 [Pirellulaceae bacterium]|nr:hypothetical protein [Pirellulaceae bacterium]